MKKLLLILCTVWSINIYAGGAPTLKVVEDKTFILNVNNWKGYELTVSFFNEKGEEFYSENIHPSITNIKEYNLQVLRKGNYQVRVSNFQGSVTYEIQVTNEKITSISEGKVTTKPAGISRDIVSKIKNIH